MAEVLCVMHVFLLVVHNQQFVYSSENNNIYLKFVVFSLQQQIVLITI